MKGILNKIASILALIIGGMAIFSGGKVLVGIDPGYYVIDWVPIYNFIMGIITVFFTTVLLWKNHNFALTAAGATLAAHSIVMIILQTVYRSSIAVESILAMTIRIVVWIAILVLMIIQARKVKVTQPAKETKTEMARS
jgi:hypothetical protein